MLTDDQLNQYQTDGHVTVDPIVNPTELDRLCESVEGWMEEVASSIPESEASWFFEKKSAGSQRYLRKLEQPVYYRSEFRELAKSPALLSIVEQLLGSGVTVFYSQVFCKPPGVGGPKPAHQDNFYFGPESPEQTLTVWFALDEATAENGCLAFVNGSHQESIVEHTAPQGEPFNLQIAPELAGERIWQLAPVPAGGVSFHHGNVWHRSEANTSTNARRAVAMHFIKNSATLVKPALTYDPKYLVRVTG